MANHPIRLHWRHRPFCEESMWSIQLLGGLCATAGDRVVIHFRTQKAALLLAYLAYYHERIHPREALIELLWPECEPQAGRNNLSKELSWLRAQLESGRSWSSRPADTILI